MLMQEFAATLLDIAAIVDVERTIVHGVLSKDCMQSLHAGDTLEIHAIALEKWAYDEEDLVLVLYLQPESTYATEVPSKKLVAFENGKLDVGETYRSYAQTLDMMLGIIQESRREQLITDDTPVRIVFHSSTNIPVGVCSRVTFTEDAVFFRNILLHAYNCTCKISHNGILH